ncbi:MAG: hypothetical protein ABSF65_11955 [Candidatus Bathyarchaeia archaeon]
MRAFVFVLLVGLILALPMTYLGVPAGCHNNWTETAAGAGNSTWTQGFIVTFLGKVVYSYIQYSFTGPSSGPVPSFPLPGIPWGIAITFMMNLGIAIIFVTILWQIIEVVWRH